MAQPRRSVERREQLAVRLVTLVGADLLKLDDPQLGWPALGQIRLGDEWVQVALFVAPVTSSHRPARAAIERRFQNPGGDRPILFPAGRIPLLIGLWDHDEVVDVPQPVVVVAEASRREGLSTRYSVFVGLPALQIAAKEGWSEHISGNGETMHIFHPPLLPVQAMADRYGVTLPPELMPVVTSAAGLNIGAEPDAADRVRRLSATLVRAARFSRDVVGAYGGLCAMCGLDLGLVQAAHIYPASAPGSLDVVPNGVALCANHHVAFDRHLVWVHPGSMEIRLHSEVLDQRTTHPAAAAFVDVTLPALSMPTSVKARPTRDMFQRRYDYFEGRYAWADSL